MTGYSSIFSSGLLATPRPNRHTDYEDHPALYQSGSADTDPDATPTRLSSNTSSLMPSSEEMTEYLMSRSRASSNASTTSSVLGNAPRLRRRRSSLSVANNGLGAVKSPQRNAGIALQRTALMGTANRARSGSTDYSTAGMLRADEGGYAPASGRIGGHSRSGSTSGTLRTRRALPKSPPVPPPNMPLPSPPNSPTVREISPRRPLVHRTHTVENFAPFSAVHGPPAQTLDLKVLAAMATASPSSSPLSELSAFLGPSAWMNEN